MDMIFFSHWQHLIRWNFGKKLGNFGILGNFQTFSLRAKKCTSKCKKLKSQCNFKSTRQDLSVGSLILLVQFCLAKWNFK